MQAAKLLPACCSTSEIFPEISRQCLLGCVLGPLLTSAGFRRRKDTSRGETGWSRSEVAKGRVCV